MSRKEYFGGNWKMNHDLAAGKAFFEEAKAMRWSGEKETVFFVPFHILLSLQQNYSAFTFGAQNLYHQDQGAFTGEISAWMLTREGIEESIVGHSERRTIFAETDEMIRKKVETGLEKGMRIVLCVGETLELREKSEHFSFVRSQLESALKGLSVKNSEKLVIAYEPVWAIGTGRTAAPAQAQEMHAFIRKELCDMGLAGESIRIIYGGSVKPSNVRELMACADIDGALVGGASLKAEDFHSLVHY